MLTDARVLQEDFVPADVVHRHEEVNRLSAALDPLVDGGRADDAFLFGPTGVGKTCVARYTLSRLERELLDVRIQYVNCWRDNTRFRLLYRLLEGVGETLDVHRGSTPHDVLLERLRSADDCPYVVVLDEVDQLEGRDVLYDLHALPHVSMLLVSNHEAELFAGMDDRINSRFKGGPRVRFDRYSTDELTAILQRRVEQGLTPDALTDAQLRHVADAAAGDARVGLTILRTAVRTAARAGDERITDRVLDDAVENARPTLRQQTLENLTDDQRICYEIVRERDGVSPGDLYEAYCERTADPRSRRMVRNYLSKLEHYDLVRAEGQKRAKQYVATDLSLAE
ncbi:Cdc6/Cdc18 family protein [Haloarculaceae archaeon H-GB2-1]|nr:orc1/cdc6 family replication initiation protein [Haloarculaceae archaeon H-GB1-1]MEA5386956.1 Cdc6/Cdc18 family protein [Haloarculaceae archaeon H-GB11]MEA5408460.1 Cdc6/Cdc18 family protein [Haloarculaceae archaeon H-GB2-1]